MTVELYALITAIAVATIGVIGVVFKGRFDRQIAQIDDRAKLTDSALTEVESLRRDADATDERVRKLNADVERFQKAAWDCERRCFELERKMANMTARWQKHTGLEAPP